MPILFWLLSLSARAENPAAANKYIFPTGEMLYCADQNVYGVVANQLEVWRQRNPKCDLRVAAYSTDHGILRIELWASATACRTANVYIQPNAGCAM